MENAVEKRSVWKIQVRNFELRKIHSKLGTRGFLPSTSESFKLPPINYTKVLFSFCPTSNDAFQLRMDM